MNKIFSLFLSVIVLVIIILAAIFFSENRKENNITNQTDISQSVNEGENGKNKEVAVDFTLNDIEGNQQKLSDYRGKVVVLNFWATWCGPCRSEMPDFQKVHEEISKDDKAVILAVNLNEEKNKVESFLNEFNITFNVLLDLEGEMGDIYNVSGIPTTYIIDQDGKIASQKVGVMTYDEVLLKVNNLVK